MSEQLRRALAEAGEEAVQRTRDLLCAAGDRALADLSMRCLVYAGLATATADRRGIEPGDWPDPILRAAVLSADYRAPGTSSLVGQELDEVAAGGDRLAAALARELLFATAQVLLIVDKAQRDLETFESLGDWPT